MFFTMNTEERLGTIKEVIQRLVQGMPIIELKLERTPQTPTIQNTRNQEDRTPRIDIPDFDGYSHNPEDYLDINQEWINILN